VGLPLVPKLCLGTYLAAKLQLGESKTTHEWIRQSRSFA
jgi:hypothetical protein